MSYFEWNPTFGLDVPEMDGEHRTLIGLMNDLHGLHLAKAPRAALATAVDKLVKYTVKHFSDEEAYMSKIGYADLRRHAAIHKELLERVSEHVARFQTSGKLDDPFFAFLKRWLTAHICGIDTKYAHSTQGVASSR